MICFNCGHQNNDNSNFCIKCGTKLNNQANNNGFDVGDGFAWGVLGFFFPLIGLVLFLIWRKTKPKKAKAVGIGSLVTVILVIVFWMLLAHLFYSFANRHNVDGMRFNDYLAKYIGEKYNDKCTYYGVTGATSYGQYASIYLKCDKTGDNLIKVESNYTKNDDERVIEDNYLAYKYEKQIKDYFESKVGLAFDSYYMNNHVGFCSSLVDNNTTFSEFLKDKNFEFGTQYIVRRSDFNSTDQIKKIGDEISGDVGAFLINIQVLEDESFDRFSFDESSYKFTRYRRYQISRYKGSSEIRYVTDYGARSEEGLYD